MHSFSRRTLVRYAGLLSVAATGGASAALSACGVIDRGKGDNARLPSRQYDALDPRIVTNFTVPLRLPGAEGGPLGILDVPAQPFDLTVRRQSTTILKGTQTDMIVYEARANGRNYTNPMLRVKRGADITTRLVNGLDEPTITHWHGLHVDWRNDGHPSDAIRNGQTYDYRFKVQNRSGTYWYHPHAHGTTAKQTYYGLAGLLIVEDEDEQRLRQSLDLELGVTDVPLLIQDRLFGARGSLLYPSTAMDGFQGVFGDVVLVNGMPGPVMNIDSRLYRFRVLNGSNARVYRLIVIKGGGRLPFHLVGTDGGLLARPQQLTEVFVGPAERADILVDLRGLNEGDVVFLASHTFDPMHAEMEGMSGSGSGGMAGHGGMGGNGRADAQSRLPDGTEFNLLKLTVRRRVPYDLALPTNLATVVPLDTTGATVRPITLAASGMQWQINGAQFEMERELFRSQANATEIWEITNAAASMPHPMHLHGFQFQVQERRGSPRQVADLAVGGQGRLATDLGWKDTVLVWPGETVTLAINFTHTFSGEQLYTFHCHNLEHEDAGMMVNYRVA